LVRLNNYGINFKAPLYARGSVQAAQDRLKIKIDSAKLGLLPVVSKYLIRGQQELNQLVNRQLNSMPNLTINKLEIDNGQLHYQGNFPRLISRQ